MTVSVGRPEAFSLLRSWADSGALLKCDVEVERIALCLRARIRSLGADGIRLLSDDTFSEVTLPLRDDLTFAVGDFRAAAPDEADSYDMFLTIFIPTLRSPTNPDSIVLIQVREDT